MMIQNRKNGLTIKSRKNRIGKRKRRNGKYSDRYGGAQGPL